MVADQSNVASHRANAESETLNPIPEKEAKKASIGALVGNALEWYDYFLFNTAAALVFNVQYFHTEDPAAAALASFATLAVGFLVRPVGGLLFGWLGDRAGRKSVLIITVTGIGIATGLIGFLPNYVSIGVWAPIILVILRMLQGLFIGGEWSGAMTLAVENAPLKLRAKLAALPQLGSPIATLLSSGMFFGLTLLLSADNFDSWGWRIPFWLAIPLLLVSLWIRSSMHESPIFKNLQETDQNAKAPLREVFTSAWRNVLVGTMAVLLGTAGFYIVTTFVMNYGTRVMGVERDIVLFATFIGAFFQIASIFHAGRLGQKYGATKVVVWAGIATTIVAFPCFMLIQTGNPVLLTIGVIIPMSSLTYSFAAAGPIMTGLFPARVRLSGVAVAYNGTQIVSGLTPFISTALVTAAGEHWWPAVTLLIVLSLLSVAGAVLVPRFSEQYEGYKH